MKVEVAVRPNEPYGFRGRKAIIIEPCFGSIWFSIALRPRKPEGSLGRTAQDGHLDSHTAPEL